MASMRTRAELDERYSTASHRMMRLCREILHFFRDHYRIHMPEDAPHQQLWRNHVPATERDRFDRLNARIFAMLEELLTSHRDKFIYYAFFWFIEEHIQLCATGDAKVPKGYFEAGVAFQRKVDQTENGFMDRMSSMMMDFEHLLDQHESEWPDQLLLLKLAA